ncbi:MAG: hypothetical protein ABIO43_02765 [Sphingomicrobium sp.]
MAKNITKGSSAGSRKASGKTSKTKSGTKSAPRKGVANRARSDSGQEDGNGAADMFVKLLQSPIVADLLAVAATAALAALAEYGFNSRGAGGDKKRAGKAVKEAGKAAAAAIGRRLATEVDEIRKAAKGAKADA